MAAMSFREPNQVLWRGFRPGHNGVQIIKWLTTASTNWEEVYQVTASKVFYMTFASLSDTAGRDGSLYLSIFDTTPTEIWRFLTLRVNGSVSGLSVVSNFNPPVEVPAGYFIKLKQSVDAGINAAIHGWEE